MISILIPLYNGIEFIDESVQSVIQQSYANWELIIGVNGHPANSDVYKKAKQYESIDQRIRVYDLLNIQGKVDALNYMIQYCQYDFVALLDVDDIWHPLKLKIQIPFLHLWTFKTPTFALKKYKNVKSILMVLLFLLLFGWRRSERRNMILKFCWSCLFLYPTFR